MSQVPRCAACRRNVSLPSPLVGLQILFGRQFYRSRLTDVLRICVHCAGGQAYCPDKSTEIALCAVCLNLRSVDSTHSRLCVKGMQTN